LIFDFWFLIQTRIKRSKMTRDCICICPECGLPHSYQSDKKQESHQHRIALFIDAGNLYHAVKLLNFKVDYLRLKNYFLDDANKILYKAFYYSAYDPDQAFIVRILDWLRHNGFEVVSKPVKRFTDRSEKGNLDIELALDMVLHAAHYDEAVLFSGDGDLVRVIEELHKRNKYVHVVSSVKTQPPLLAQDLRQQADKFTDLANIIVKIQKQG